MGWERLLDLSLSSEGISMGDIFLGSKIWFISCAHFFFLFFAHLGVSTNYGSHQTHLREENPDFLEPMSLRGLCRRGGQRHPHMKRSCGGGSPGGAGGAVSQDWGLSPPALWALTLPLHSEPCSCPRPPVRGLVSQGGSLPAPWGAGWIWRRALLPMGSARHRGGLDFVLGADILDWDSPSLHFLST